MICFGETDKVKVGKERERARARWCGTVWASQQALAGPMGGRRRVAEFGRAAPDPAPQALPEPEPHFGATHPLAFLLRWMCSQLHCNQPPLLLVYYHAPSCMYDMHGGPGACGGSSSSSSISRALQLLAVAASYWPPAATYISTS